MAADHHPVTSGPGAFSDAPGAEDFAALLKAATGHRYDYCGDSLALHADPDHQLVGCRSLLDEAVFSGLIDRFATQYPEADRRAIVSLWTLYYFSTLAIALAVAGLELRRSIAASIDRMTLCVDRETAMPKAFLVDDFGSVGASVTIEEALSPMLRDHLEPLVAAIAKNAGLGRRMLWNNVAAYLDWIIAEIAGSSSRPDVLQACRVYFTPVWGNGWKNPLHGLIRQDMDDEGQAISRRKICCLRYCLPGIGGCGATCPLPEGRE